MRCCTANKQHGLCRRVGVQCGQCQAFTSTALANEEDDETVARLALQRYKRTLRPFVNNSRLTCRHGVVIDRAATIKQLKMFWESTGHEFLQDIKPPSQGAQCAPLVHRTLAPAHLLSLITRFALHALVLLSALSMCTASETKKHIFS